MNPESFNDMLLFTGASAAVLIALVASMVIFGRKLGPMGINLKPVHCPKCDLRQPQERRPLNRRQALWGGWTCPACKTEMDKYGRAIPNASREPGSARQSGRQDRR